MTRTRLFVTMMLLMVLLTTRAQSVVSGVVLDRQTGHTLANVSVTAEGGRRIQSPMRKGASC